MGTSAIVMMVVSIGTVWGGLIASIAYLTTHPMDDSE
ncbi:methionine/alanine import family NSS transporter small subunit [Arcanobacterium bovis]|uniref:Methionine/alanine import family NSS transporter small subunit n=1 Tax=Arcanobacterium bovis TaxID=2529275 RepID=A0A4Q9UZB0_9ACTO|nr:methionine/alanine import family NSS transporter small subunit [Arcanobacterium bovis]TBW21059.1 methionine/alanine import family NSS transporter small subunit [Arcanobacterium bovis]